VPPAHDEPRRPEVKNALASAAAALTLAMGACGGEEAAAPSGEKEAPSSGALSVSLGEWFVKPAQADASAGEITFSATNDGKVAHELEVVKTDTPAGDLPVEGDQANVEEVGEESGEIEEIAAGASEELKVSLEPGKYVLICNIPTHYEAGMYSDFTVK
jgi:uncharacterized cupredoxin-like copper-binding protein